MFTEVESFGTRLETTKVIPPPADASATVITATPAVDNTTSVTVDWAGSNDQFGHVAAGVGRRSPVPGSPRYVAWTAGRRAVQRGRGASSAFSAARGRGRRLSHARGHENSTGASALLTRRPPPPPSRPRCSPQDRHSGRGIGETSGEGGARLGNGIVGTS